MTRREKILGLCVGGALAGLALMSGVRWVVVEPFRGMQRQIDAERVRGRNLRQQLDGLAGAETQWENWTRRTFSTDPKDAQRRFREEMHQLLEIHGLSDPKVSPGTFIKYKDGSTGVPLNISATGTLNEIVSLLTDFYRIDWLARLDKVRISAKPEVIEDLNNPNRQQRRRTGSRRSAGTTAATGASVGPQGPELTVNISALNLVLPQAGGKLRHPTMDEVVHLPQGTLSREPEEYNAIFANNLFMPFRPRPTEVKHEPNEPPRVAEGPRNPTPAPPPRVTRTPPPAALKAMGRVNGMLVAYVVDESNPEQPLTRYHLDEPIDDGTLILICAGEGVVVRVNEQGREVDYFYPLGAHFADRVELDAELHPKVWEALEREFVAIEPGTSG